MCRTFGLDPEKRAILNAGAQTVLTGLSAQVFLLVSGTVAARLLGVVGRGHLAGLMAWPSFIIPLGSLGVVAACTYYVSRQPTSAARTLGATYQIAVVQAVALTAILAAVLALWTRGKPVEVVTVAYPIVILVPAWLLHQYALATLQGLHRFGRFNMLRILPLALYALGATLLLVAGENRLGAIIAVLVGSQATSAIVSTVAVLHVVRPSWHKNHRVRHQILAFGMRSHLGALSPVDSLRIDQAIGAVLLSVDQLGLYVAAYAFCNLPRLIADGAGKVLYPTIARVKAGKPQMRLLWLVFAGVTAVNVVLSTILILVMPFLITLFFGAQFSDAGAIARILLVGTTIVASRRILADGLRGLGQSGTSTITEIVMYPWLVVAAPILAIASGAKGLAVALALGYGLSLAVAVGATIKITRRNSTAARS